MAAPLAPVMGFNGKLYYNSGTHGSPTWVLIANVGDIKVGDERKETDVEVRSQGGFSVAVFGLRKAHFEFSMVYDPADTAQSALRTAYANNTPTEFLVLDGPQATVGSSGLLATMGVQKFPRQEEINSGMMIDVKIAPTYSANAPSAYTAA